MKINKNQAVYKYLPYCWADYSKDKKFYTVRVIDWNTNPITDIFKSKITEEIQRSIKMFENRSGDVSDFRSLTNDNIEFAEPVMNEQFPDIKCEIDPLLFYCSKCGSLRYVQKKDAMKPHICNNCQIPMKQLQYVYSCECGHAEGITIPYDIKKKNPKFLTTRKNHFRFQYSEGKNEKPREMVMKCPNCGKILYPKNANDRINFNPFSIRAVNLIEMKIGNLLDSDNDAIYIFIAKWLNQLNDSEYKKIIDNPSMINSLSSNSNLENKIEELLDEHPEFSREKAIELIKFINPNMVSSNEYIEIISSIKSRLQGIDDYEKKIIISQLIEFLTLSSAKREVTLTHAKRESIRLNTILSEEDIDKSNKKIGVLNAKLVSDVEIINSSYAFTRKGYDPSLNENPKVRLKLNSFFKGGKYKAYTSKLFTEGILIEFDRKTIIDWLIENSFLDNNIDTSNQNELKLWFIKHIKPSAINGFSEIEYIGNDYDILLTKLVYGLIHTLSHLFIKSSGYISGIDKDSMSEMIFANIPAIFIYSTSVQGISLGALETMFTNNYLQFIDYAFQSPENCIIDPICMEEQQGRCFSCLFLSEVTCSHFNKDLSRLLLFGGEYHLSETYKIDIVKGFFE